MTQFDLLNKTELTIAPVWLEKANLTDIAATVAGSLGLARDDVLVVDYRDTVLVLDILNHCVDAYKMVGRKTSLLGNLEALPGVRISEKTDVTSGGMLGWIAADREAACDALIKGEQLVSDIRAAIARRVLVFSSGEELLNKEIEDTNTPVIKAFFEASGFQVFNGEILIDDKAVIAAKLRQAAQNGGYGMIITTGGVGAEDKDQTVEAVKMLDPDAATPYICHFKIGTGRHVKNGIKIAAGEVNGTRIIALPGPNDEVRASLAPILEGIKTGAGKQDLAESIAANLRQILRQKMKHHHGGDGHEGCQLHRNH